LFIIWVKDKIDECYTTLINLYSFLVLLTLFGNIECIVVEIEITECILPFCACSRGTHVSMLCSFVPPPPSVDSEADKDLSDLLDFSAVSDPCSEMLY